MRCPCCGRKIKVVLFDASQGELFGRDECDTPAAARENIPRNVLRGRVAASVRRFNENSKRTLDRKVR